MTEASEETATTDTAEPTPDPAQDKDLEAQARKWEKRAKENFEKAQRLERTESELEKATARAEAAEKDLVTARSTAERATVALTKGLTAAQAKRLVGGTREELEADADELLEDLQATKATPPRATDQKKKDTSPASDPDRAFVGQLFNRR